MKDEIIVLFVQVTPFMEYWGSSVGYCTVKRNDTGSAFTCYERGSKGDARIMELRRSVQSDVSCRWRNSHKATHRNKTCLVGRSLELYTSRELFRRATVCSFCEGNIQGSFWLL